MIERQTELKRRYHRKKKMAKLKTKLKAATGEARIAVLAKIKKLSPTWTEASLTQGQTAAPSANKSEPKSNTGGGGGGGEKRKAPAKPRAEKK
jgi:hypothetical protein